MGKVWEKFIKIWDYLEKFQIVKAAFAAKYPALVAALAAYFGIAEGQPVMWIIMATSLVFMSMTVGLIYVNAWRISRSPENKLRYTGTIINYDLKPLNRNQNRTVKATGAAAARRLDKTQIGVQLRNDASYPLSVILENATTKMEDKEPPRSTYPRAAVILLPGNTIMLSDDPINMDDMACEKLEGRMDIIIKYGLPGKENFKLEFKGRVEALMYSQGFITQIYTHWDAAQIKV